MAEVLVIVVVQEVDDGPAVRAKCSDETRDVVFKTGVVAAQPTLSNFE